MFNRIALVVAWAARRLLTFTAIAATAIAIIFLRAGTVPVKGHWPQFYLDRYWPALKQYLSHLARGSFGKLYLAPPGGGLPPVPIPSNALVADVLGRNLPGTITLFACALVAGVLLGILLGMAASRFSWSWLRHSILGATVVGLSFPDILLVVLLQFGLIGLNKALGVKLLSPYGDLLKPLSVKELIFPTLLLTTFPAAYSARLSVAAFDDVYSEDYIRAARAKGLTGARTLWKHAFKNAAIQILGGIPTVAGVLISNLVIVEYLMNLQGIGRMLTVEFTARYPSPNLIASIAIIFVAMFYAVDSLVDAVMQWIDPRSGQARNERQLEQDRWRNAPVPARMKSGLTSVLLTPVSIMIGLGALLADTGRRLWNFVRRPDRAELRCRLRRISQHYRTNFPLAAGTVIVLGLILVAVFAKNLAPHDPNKMNPVLIQGRNFSVPPFPRSAQFPLGTDAVGHDLLSMVIHGTRYTLLIAALIVPLRLFFGLLFGMAAGWLGGFWEQLVKRVALFSGAVPSIVIPAILIPVIFPRPEAQTFGNPNALPPPNPYMVLAANIMLLVLIGWPRLAESIRLMTRELMERPFFEGARAVGAPTGRLMRFYIIPHLLPRLAVIAAAEAAWVMMLIAQLGIFDIWLGGAKNLESEGFVPFFPDWSHMLSHPVRYLFANQQIILVPGVAFFVAILGFQLLSEGFRRASLRSE